MSSTSTAALSLFDDPSSPPSGSTTPLTPAFLSTSLSSSVGAEDKSLPDRFAALQDEFSRSKKTWRAQRGELEAQVRALQIELEKQREAASTPRQQQRQLKEGEECDRCGATVSVAVKVSVEEKAQAPESTSVIQRPRFKVCYSLPAFGKTKLTFISFCFRRVTAVLAPSSALYVLSPSFT
jgi:hypothetical protein